ncbi:MAG: hypothetical protein ACK5E6_05275 [Cyanobacteriota bacterium]|jgi:hypothetical protein
MAFTTHRATTDETTVEALSTDQLATVNGGLLADFMDMKLNPLLAKKVLPYINVARLPIAKAKLAVARI